MPLSHNRKLVVGELKSFLTSRPHAYRNNRLGQVAGRDKVPTLLVVLQGFVIRPGCGLECFWSVFQRFALHPKACGPVLERFWSVFEAFLEGLRCVRKRAERFWSFFGAFLGRFWRVCVASENVRSVFGAFF